VSRPSRPRSEPCRSNGKPITALAMLTIPRRGLSLTAWCWSIRTGRSCQCAAQDRRRSLHHCGNAPANTRRPLVYAGRCACRGCCWADRRRRSVVPSASFPTGRPSPQRDALSRHRCVADPTRPFFKSHRGATASCEKARPKDDPDLAGLETRAQTKWQRAVPTGSMRRST